MALTLLLFVLSSLFHNDLEHLIEEVSTAIQSNPADADLYLRRGKYYRQTGNYVASSRDFQMALSLDSSKIEVLLELSRNYVERLDPDSAIMYLDKFQILHEPTGDSQFLMAASAALKNQTDLALEGMQNALNLLSKPQPKHFLLLSEMHLNSELPGSRENALSWLDNGIKELGWQVVLAERKVDIWVESGAFNQALTEIDSILVHFDRKEKWYYRKALILEKAGLDEEAKQMYEACIEQINLLPSRHRFTPAMQHLLLDSVTALN